jgi:hypothetical protein
MTGEQRVLAALAMADEAREISMSGIRARRPELSDESGETRMVAAASRQRVRGTPDDPMMSQFGFLAEVIAALDAAGVTYMVTGSIASTHHAEPRMTRDIDIVIETDHVAVKLLVNQFDPTRFYVGNAQQAVADRDMFNVIDTPGAGRWI